MTFTSVEGQYFLNFTADGLQNLDVPFTAVAGLPSALSIDDPINEVKSELSTTIPTIYVTLIDVLGQTTYYSDNIERHLNVTVSNSKDYLLLKLLFQSLF